MFYGICFHLSDISPSYAICLRLGIFTKTSPNFSFASLRSNSFCMLSQNFELVPKYFERRKAISTEIFLLLWTKSKTELVDTPRSFASLYGVISSGSRNSSTRMSPIFGNSNFLFIAASVSGNPQF